MVNTYSFRIDYIKINATFLFKPDALKLEYSHWDHENLLVLIESLNTKQAPAILPLAPADECELTEADIDEFVREKSLSKSNLSY